MSLLERLVEPERVIQFRVVWLTIATRYRSTVHGVCSSALHRPVQRRYALSPFSKPFHSQFLGFEQTFKNALTTLPMGGGKAAATLIRKGKAKAKLCVSAGADD